MASPSLFPLPIEALGPLKTYLVDQLAPISDADSSLLSDYTVALLKAAEASDAEVEAEVKTQLRDFLDHSAPPALESCLPNDPLLTPCFYLLRHRCLCPGAVRCASLEIVHAGQREPDSQAVALAECSAFPTQGRSTEVTSAGA